jgi:hypothetical protein
MATIRQRMRRVLKGGLLLRELKGVRSELARIAAALETYNAHQWPQSIQPDPSIPAVEVSYVDTQVQAELLEIELRLTSATGQAPTEDEVVAEYVRRYPDSDLATRGGLQ